MTRARYLLGVDLGTTNCLLSYIDTCDSAQSIHTLLIPQSEGVGVVTSHYSLPAALYLPLKEERDSHSFEIPWISDPDWCVGQHARDQAAFSPDRTITSAKSWLCSDAVDREAQILPWMSAEVETTNRISPVAASSIYLSYLKRVWEQKFPEEKFSEQEITITVPASFDEDAQLLTIQAAQIAGYPQSTRLLEEPQAAFYDWLATHRSVAHLEELLPELKSTPQRILVCDVGGGTTDFSLFEITPRTETELFHSISRIAVSNHVLLGGDNIDRGIAHIIERSFLSQGCPELTKKQWCYVLAQARQLKEQVLCQTVAAGSIPVVIPSEGAGLIAGTRSITFDVAAAYDYIFEGFFPLSSYDARPRRSSTALRERGLHYATDSRVTVYLAEFLAGSQVDAVLFNGGMLKPEKLRVRIVSCLASWQGGRTPIVLENTNFASSVSRGAAFFSLARRLQERQIQGGHARSLYLELADNETATTLLCVIPQGAEVGTTFRLDKKFLLTVNQPVKFQAFSASRRPDDAAGQIVAHRDDSFRPLPALQTALRLSQRGLKISGSTIAVHLTASINDLGLAQIAFITESGEERWSLEFNTRANSDDCSRYSETTTPTLTLPPEAVIEQLELLLGRYYGKGYSAPTESPKRLLEEIEDIYAMPRAEWPAHYLRAIWPPIFRGMTRKGRSIIHEVAWLSLAGYALRPGYGVELDEWKIQELSQCLKLGLNFPKEARVLNQWWIMWRRVAGGLNRERQELLAKDALIRLEKGASDAVEIIRALGAFERLSLENKRRIGRQIIKTLTARKHTSKEHLIWCLRRLTARVPLYATVDFVIPPSLVMEWFDAVASLDWRAPEYAPLCGAFAQACRRTGDRARELASDDLARVREKLISSGARSTDLKLLTEIVPIEANEQHIALGDSLPVGLQLAV